MSDAKPLVFYDRAMIGHDPGDGHPECPERLKAIEAVLEAHRGAMYELEAPSEATSEAIGRAHTGPHVERILGMRDDYGVIDPDTRLSPGSVRAAMLAAGSAVAAVEALIDGDAKTTFAAVRPPGHHAEADRAMGFCLFNNVAIAAAHARAKYGLERVLVLDWDVHHGNGTQHIFYDDPSVLFMSAHQYPFYPGTGALRETGTGDGQGRTVNIPLSGGASDGDYRLAFEEIVRPIADAFEPELVLVSAGFDAHGRDPLGGMELTSEGFADMCAVTRDIAVRHADGRLGLFLEGGYDLEALAHSALACLEVMAGNAPPDRAVARTARAEAEIRAAREHHRRHWPGALV